jgi:arsenate reductase
MSVSQANRPRHVLFLCTGNSARSIMAEALLNHFGQRRFRAYSAGSHPVGRVHPLVLEQLAQEKIDATGARSKSWDEFVRAGAPQFDFVITVCDRAAGETCPVWPGHPARMHWSIEDPAAADGTEAGKTQAFRAAFGALEVQVRAFVANC